MFVECIKNNGIPYLRLVEGVRVTNKNGYRTSQKKVIIYIGPLSRFDDGEPDYVARLKQSFKAGEPLIPELKPYCSKEQPLEDYFVHFKEGSPGCTGHSRLFSQLLLERILEEIGLYSLFHTYKNTSKIQYDVYGFFKLLVFGRILNPASKCSTVRQNEDYYEPVLKEGFNPDNVYDTLTFIAQNKNRIIRRMNTNLVRKTHRSPEIIFYDVTNFYFETEEPDEDILDEEGDVLEKGMRKMGVSKENRKQPIVQMGLFMDDNGIPISIETFPGNTLDYLTLRPALEKNIDDLDLSRFILIADRGMCNYPNLLHVLDQGNGYIVSKSLLKSTKKEREWAYSTEGYTWSNEEFRYKSRIVKSQRKDENGKDRFVEEKVVVYWSKKIKDRCMAENRSFLEFLKKLEESPASFRITATQAKSLRRFMSRECINQETGEILDSEKIRGMIDFNKVRAFEEEMGYYQIVTSELTMEDLEIIEKYHGLKQIEDQFRVMKGVLEARPIYVRTPEHIEAHLVLCLVALVVTRIIQKRVSEYEGPIPKKNGKNSPNWSYGISAERLQEALKKWKVDKLPGDLYRFDSTDDADLKRILDAFGIQISEKLYRRGELKQIKTTTQIFM